MKNEDEFDGDYYRIVIKPREDFVMFRTHDVGKKGDIQRLAGLNKDGKWGTQAWLIHKSLAHVKNQRLVADDAETLKLFDKLPSEPKHIEGNLFSSQ